MPANTSANQIFNYLVSKDLDPEIQKVPNPNDPDADPDTLFTFDFLAPSGKNYGTAVILLGDSLEMYFGDNLGSTMEGDDKDSWYNFLLALRNIARRNMLTYDFKELNKLKHSLRGQAKLSEAVFESLTGNRTRSWSAPPEQARMVIHHSKPLSENDARFRNIDKIFIETSDGERYRLPFRSLRGAKAMLEHVRQGGRPYDIRGQHIVEMVNELNILSKFNRANQNRIFEGSTAALIEQTTQYYKETKSNLNRLASSRGYQHYFESWNPIEVNEQNLMVEDLRNMFIETSIDQRIESALPLLARIQQRETTMKETAEFESFVSNLAEGTWALPDTPALKEKLKELLSQPLTVGVDALNATEQLYDIFGDDQLFDSLTELAAEDPEADARPAIMARLQEIDSALHFELDAAQQQATEPQQEPPQATAPQPAPAQPAPQTTQPPVQEGKVKQLSMDMGELNDNEFYDKYKKTKDQVRGKIGPIFTSRDTKHKEEMAKLKSLLSRLNA